MDMKTFESTRDFFKYNLDVWERNATVGNGVTFDGELINVSGMVMIFQIDSGPAEHLTISLNDVTNRRIQIFDRMKIVHPFSRIYIWGKFTGRIAIHHSLFPGFDMSFQGGEIGAYSEEVTSGTNKEIDSLIDHIYILDGGTLDYNDQNGSSKTIAVITGQSLIMPISNINSGSTCDVLLVYRYDKSWLTV
jgi:hypothetical protein